MRFRTLFARRAGGVVAALLAVLTLSRCGGGDGPTETGPATVSIVSGDGQAALIGTALPDPLRVQVTDPDGAGVNDVRVDFRVESGNAALDPAVDTTSGGGFAETRVMLGEEGGDVVIIAEAAGVADPARFTVTALAPASVEVASGDGVSAPIGGEVALEARVRDQRGDPLGGVTVGWAITDSAGPGAGLASPTSVTDEMGIAGNTLTLGDTEGIYRVTASVAAVTDDASFSLNATPAPRIIGVSPSPVREGSPATLDGQDFATVPEDNVVTFDGVAATVTSASPTQLDIVVPETACLPARDSAAFRAEVAGVAGPTVFGPAVPRDSSIAALGDAEHQIRSDSAGVECVQVPAQGGTSDFLIVPAVATSSSGVNVPERLRRTVGSDSIFGTGGFAPEADESRESAGRFQRPRELERRLARLNASAEAERRLREYERRLHRTSAPAARAAFGGDAMAGAAGRAATGAAATAPGDTVTLKVINADAQDFCNDFDTVTAIVKSVGTTAIAVEDTAAPAGGFSTADYDEFVAEFDAATFPTDTLYFGSPSDIDENGATFLVFTPEINKLSEPGAGSFTGGFFFSGDLFPATGQNSCAASNEGEYTYLLVPDPNGDFGIDFSTEFVRELSRGTITHEFQHLINAAQRIFVAETGPEEIWLNEGLSHLAEEVVGHAVTGLSPGSNITFAEATMLGTDRDDYDAFYFQNFARLSTYLEDPDSVSGNSPIDADADLPTRGAIWNFLRWILDQERSPSDENSLTRSLVITDLSGIQNLETAVGVEFEELLPEWLLALFADDFVGGVDPRLEVTSWDMRDIYTSDGQLGGGYPLAPISLTQSDGDDQYTIVSGSGRYFQLSSGGSSPAISLRLTDSSGNPLDLENLLARTLVLRLP